MRRPTFLANPLPTLPVPAALLAFAALTAITALAGACGPAPEVEPTGEPAAASPSAAMAAGATDPTPASEFAGPIETAHGLDAWRGHDAVEADVTVTFGGDTVFAGRMLFPTDLATSRLETESGTVAVFDGDAAWVSGGEMPGARFHLLTWPYFLAAPMKFQDPGSRLDPLPDAPLTAADDTTYRRARLSFEDGVGDSPDDWYVLYRHPETDRLTAMGYIVTYSTPAEQAEQEPHAIVYDDFRDIDGVAVPTNWSFYDWSDEGGVEGEPIGQATLSNVRFVTPDPGAFEVPEGATEDPLPSPERPVERPADEQSAEEPDAGT